MTKTAHAREKRWRAGVVTGHPTQWEGPLFGHLQRASKLDLRVFYGSRLGLDAALEPESGISLSFDMPGLVEGYDFSFEAPTRLAALRLARAFRSLDVVVLEGYSGFPQRAALTAALATRRPLVLRLDSTHLYEAPWSKRIAKQAVLPSLFRRFSAFLALSSPTAEYLESYGVPRSAIIVSTYRVNNDWYAAQTAYWRDRASEVRAELGLGNFSKVALAIVRFEYRENPFEFLAAAESFARANSDVGFVLVGGGRLDSEVREFVRARSLSNVVLPGYRPITDLPKFFSVADVFVHPAREECWGLSVNEAMASGVPVIVSDRVGCRYDLLPRREVGRVYPSGSSHRLAAEIREVLADDEQRLTTARSAREQVDRFSYDAAIEEFERAIRIALQRR